MFLLSPQQLSSITRQEQTIRHVAEDDLDAKMRAILDETGLDPHEKIKKYDALLQRYLNLMKQGRKQEEEKSVRVTLQTAPDNETSMPKKEEVKEDVISDMLKTLALRDRKHAEYIIKKMPERWSSKGEFVHQGTPLQGSHMLDLIRHLMHWTRKSQPAPPTGWRAFLSTLTELNIPTSTIRNPLAREQYERMRSGTRDTEAHVEEQDETRNVKKRKKDSAQWLTL